MKIIVEIETNGEIVLSVRIEEKRTFMAKNIRLDDLPKVIREGCKKIK